MAVENRHAHALAGDLRQFCFHDLSVLYFTEHTQRFLLALLFLSADERDNISNHLRPVFECLAGSGDRLIGRYHEFFRAEFLPCSQARSITLDRAVRFYRNESAGCSKTFLLVRNHIEVVCVDLRHNHRHIRRPAVRAVVGYNRRLCLRVLFLDGFDLILAHVNCAENEVNGGCHMLHIIYIENNKVLHSLRHRRVHFPASAYCLFISLTCGTGACRHRNHLKPRVVLQQRDKSLTYHTCCSQNTYS